MQEMTPGITNQYLHLQQCEITLILLKRASRINLGGKGKRNKIQTKRLRDYIYWGNLKKKSIHKT